MDGFHPFPSVHPQEKGCSVDAPQPTPCDFKDHGSWVSILGRKVLNLGSGVPWDFLLASQTQFLQPKACKPSNPYKPCKPYKPQTLKALGWQKGHGLRFLIRLGVERLEGLEFAPNWHSRFKVLGFRVWGLGSRALVFRLPGFSGLGCGVQGLSRRFC